MTNDTIRRLLRARLMIAVGGCPMVARARYPHACIHCRITGTHENFLPGLTWAELWSCERRLLGLMKENTNDD